MDNGKSLSVAVHRCEDQEQFERIRRGLDAQTWATLVALAGSIIGPLFFGGWISFEVFAFVVGAALSTVAAVTLIPSRRWGERGPASVGGVTAMALGSATIFIPSLLLRVGRGQPVHNALIAVLLVGGVFWFAGECAKMHLVEECARLVSGREIIRRARHLRWGTYAVALLLVAGVLPVAFRGFGEGRHLTVHFILMISVSLMVFSLLGSLVNGQLSMALAQQISFANAIRHSLQTVNPRLVPNEPDWVIEA